MWAWCQVGIVIGRCVLTSCLCLLSGTPRPPVPLKVAVCMRGWTGCPMSWPNTKPADRKGHATWTNWWRGAAFQKDFFKLYVSVGWRGVMDSKLTSDFPSAPFVLPADYFLIHVLTQNLVIGCCGRGGLGFVTGELPLIRGGVWEISYLVLIPQRGFIVP